MTPFPGAVPEVSPPARYESKETVELAFVAALQLLPGRQRAALLLRDVLGFSAAETAVALDPSVASVNSALQRARRALADRTPERSQQQTLRALGDTAGTLLVQRFVRAWEQGDVDGLVRLLTEDVELTMPPHAAWFRGRADVREFLRRVPLAPGLRWRGRAVAANGQLACALWLNTGAGAEAHSINVLTVTGGLVGGIAAFRSPALFGPFGLPAAVRGAATGSAGSSPPPGC